MAVIYKLPGVRDRLQCGPMYSMRLAIAGDNLSAQSGLTIVTRAGAGDLIARRGHRNIVRRNGGGRA